MTKHKITNTDRKIRQNSLAHTFITAQGRLAEASGICVICRQLPIATAMTCSTIACVEKWLHPGHHYRPT